MSLDIPPAEMQALADAVVKRCVEHLANVADPRTWRADAKIDAASCRRMREDAPPAFGTPIEALLEPLFREWIPRSLGTVSPHYFGYIPGGGLYTAALADFISSTANRYTGMWESAPALLQLEGDALNWIRQLMGFPDGTLGLFTTGATMATFNAIICARELLITPKHQAERNAEDCTEQANLLRSGVMYLSAEAHDTIPKAAYLAGIMPDRIRRVETDSRFRMRVDALERAMMADVDAGRIPFAVVSSAGTTNTGAVDPLEEVGTLCRSVSANLGTRVWHHIDGAYGGFFNICDETREALRGISAADSLTLDPHKAMFLPYGTGALLVADGARLRLAHKAHIIGEAAVRYNAALPPDDMHDPHSYSHELTRGFPGLRVWLSIKLFGLNAFRDALAEKRALALGAFSCISTLPGVVVVAPPELSLFAFHLRWPGATLEEENDATENLVKSLGASIVTGWKVGRPGRYLARICILSFRTHQQHVDTLVDEVTVCARRILAAR